MGYVGNSPENRVLLRLQARKSFALGIWLQDHNGNPLDISGTTIRIVVRKLVNRTVTDDNANLVTNSEALILAPTLGLARFELQATDLNYPPGEYQYSIVLWDGGYSTTIVAGDLELEQNMEFTSLEETYPVGDEFSTALAVKMRGNSVIQVRTGPTLLPGEVTFTEDLANKLLAMYAGQLAAGLTLTADDIVDGVEKVIMTNAERLILLQFADGWAGIPGKPDFGTIITYDDTDFIKVLEARGEDITAGVVAKAHLPKVSGHRGFSVGTDVPTGGEPGDLYFKYQP